MKRLKIAVLMGGPSAEREVSLRSGTAVVTALTATGAKVVPIDIKETTFSIPADVDVAFVALHGTFGEDGTLQRILEDTGIAYTGSGPEASARAFDKIAAKVEFQLAEIPTPKSELFDRTDTDWSRLARLGFPLVVKPSRQGSSVGISIVQEEADLEEACQIAWRYDNRLVVEQFIAGRELTVGIFDGRALPVIEIHPKHDFFTYEAKYTKGQTDYLVPAPLEKSIEAKVKMLALRARLPRLSRSIPRGFYFSGERRTVRPGGEYNPGVHRDEPGAAGGARRGDGIFRFVRATRADGTGASRAKRRGRRARK